MTNVDLPKTLNSVLFKMAFEDTENDLFEKIKNTRSQIKDEGETPTGTIFAIIHQTVGMLDVKTMAAFLAHSIVKLALVDPELLPKIDFDDDLRILNETLMDEINHSEYAENPKHVVE